MTQDLRTTVAIVGGGPVGMALSISLAQRGIRNVVLERYRDPQPVPKGQNLTQRTMEHFRQWGIEDELRAARTTDPTERAGGLTAYGSLVSDYHYPWMQRESVGQFYAAANERLPQYATERVLRERVAGFRECMVLYDSTVDHLSEDADGVSVEYVTTSGARGSVRAEYVVGCDGSRSVVRESVGITQTRADHDRLMLLLVFRSTAFDRLMERFPGVSYVNVLNPELEGYWQFFGRVDARETWFFHAPVPPGATTTEADIDAMLSRATGTSFEWEPQYIGSWDLRFTLADSYRAGRVFVAGDAAHSHPPYGGYGVNSGFEDAANLAWKLAASVDGWAGPNLLDSYDAERRPVFASTRDDFIEQSIHRDRDFLAQQDPGVDAEAFAAAWGERSVEAMSEVDAFEPHYGGSPVVVGGADSTSARGSHSLVARPGHHLSPGSTSAGGEVFAALGSGFTLLTAPDVDADAFVTAAADLGVPLSHVPLDAETAAAYEATAVLVRPDQFIAWAGALDSAAPEQLLETAVGR